MNLDQTVTDGRVDFYSGPYESPCCMFGSRCNSDVKTDQSWTSFRTWRTCTYFRLLGVQTLCIFTCVYIGIHRRSAICRKERWCLLSSVHTQLKGERRRFSDRGLIPQPPNKPANSQAHFIRLHSSVLLWIATGIRVKNGQCLYITSEFLYCLINYKSFIYSSI